MKKQSDDRNDGGDELATVAEKSSPFGHLTSAAGEESLNLPPAPRKPSGLDLSGGPGGVVRRDWAAALDLINEACEAVKMSEQRAKDAELYNMNLVQSHAEQVKRLEARAKEAESRAEAAERRAAEAEEWLLLFHDTIVAGVKGVLDR